MRAPFERARRHWLLASNVVVAVFVGLPFLAAVLMAVGLPDAAAPIYAAYQSVCHQWAFRSYFLFGPELTYGPAALAGLIGREAMYGTLGSPELGYKVAFCQRDVAIYLAVLVGGIAYAARRGRVAPLGLLGYAVLIAPMALDGFTQLFGWRESTVELRTVTGALFGLASVWLIYPRVDDVLGWRPAPSARALAPSAQRV